MEHFGELWGLVKQYPFYALVFAVSFLVTSTVALLHGAVTILKLLTWGVRLFRHAWELVLSAWLEFLQELPARKRDGNLPAEAAPPAVEAPVATPAVGCERQRGRFLVWAQSIKATRARRRAAVPMPASFAVQGRRLSAEVRE
jgi:hypothetical protein